MNDKIKIIVDKLNMYNDAYREGNSIVSDLIYDELYDELYGLDPNNEYFSKVGTTIDTDDRKSLLPIYMASMNKVKTIDSLYSWIRLKNIPINSDFILTPKYDGISLCVDEESLPNNVWTRGDGEYGQKSNEHYKLINNKLKNKVVKYSYGELMMHKNIFEKKYSEKFKNPRNLVAGLMNSKEISDMLQDCNYIRYGAASFDEKIQTKSELLELLNENQDIKVPYVILKIQDITEEKLKELFVEWSKEYTIDGIIIEINNTDLQDKLGRETSTNNPCWARAYKSILFEEEVTTDVIGIKWNISKNGYLKPIIQVKPVLVDGVTISNVTGNNAKFVKDMGIGVGSIVKIRRSGMVIPLISEVVKKVDFDEPKGNVTWSKSGIELITTFETDDQKLKKIISFFEILEVKNVSEGIFKKLWDSGYKTISDILKIQISDLEKLDGFGKRKSEIVYNEIQNKMKNVSLEKLQHASGIFQNLGSKKLELLKHFKTKPTIEEITSIDGFSDISALSYINGYDRFNKFIKDLPITIKEDILDKKTKISNELENMTFVFSGIRDKNSEAKIVEMGGKIGSTVSKNTTHLIMKVKGTGSSKEEKAISLGIKILTIDELAIILSK